MSGCKICTATIPSGLILILRRPTLGSDGAVVYIFGVLYFAFALLFNLADHVRVGSVIWLFWVWFDGFIVIIRVCWGGKQKAMCTVVYYTYIFYKRDGVRLRPETTLFLFLISIWSILERFFIVAVLTIPDHHWSVPLCNASPRSSTLLHWWSLVLAHFPFPPPHHQSIEDPPTGLEWFNWVLPTPRLLF